MGAGEAQVTDIEAKASSKRWIIVGVATFIVLAGGALGTLFALGMLGSEPVEAAAEGTNRVERRSPIYLSLDPPFTVNFTGNSRARFLQVTVDVMTRDPLVEGRLKQHMPVVRNNLVLLFSSKTSSELSTMEGKQALQQETLEAIQKLLTDETGDKGIEAVYFTSFVMQ
jgi:flagellar protein FliL